MKNVSFRIEDDTLKMLDVIAKAEHVDRSAILNNLVEQKIDLYTWQLEKIEKGIAQADKGQYAQDCELLRLLLD